MHSKSRKYGYILIMIILALFFYFGYQIAIEAKPLEVIFLDVGQGDSILIQKGEQQILIDGGPSGKTEMAKLGQYLPYFDREIEIVIATHPDKDHIAGLVEIGRNYKIGKVLTTKAEKDTAVFREWRDILEYNRIEVLEARSGDQIDFAGASLKIISPFSSVEQENGDANNQSVVVKLDFGESSFLMTGDIESSGEAEIIASGADVDIDVLKVAHHGSKHSSSEAFLDAVSPEEAVISVGAKNSYGHPTEAVLEALRKRDIKIWRTDEKGDIVYSCDSSKCKVQNEK